MAIEPTPNNSKPTPDLPPSGGSSPSGHHPAQGPTLWHILLIMFLITFGINQFLFGRDSNAVPEIAYSQFIQLVHSHSAQEVKLEADKLIIRLRPDADPEVVQSIIHPDQATAAEPGPLSNEDSYFTARIDDPGLVDRLQAFDVNFYKEYTPPASPMVSFIASWIVPTLLLYFIYFFVIRKAVSKLGQSGGGMGNMFGIGKSKAKEYNVEERIGISFRDVAGQDEAKESLMEMVDILQNPEKYKAIGAKQPKGALLVGPPGTGKTLLAKAVAGEAQVPFYWISGSEFVEMFVGVGASRVRDLFEEAKKHNPCIIFIDEIDAIGRSRDSQMGGNDEREQTLNQLLTEMDGFGSGEGVIVLAATNRPEILDPALLRPGRFDRRIIVEKPDLAGREAVLAVHAEGVELSSEVDLRAIALLTSGATGADLANMVNEAALLAVKAGRSEVVQADLQEAVELVIAGKEKKDRILNPKEREIVAYHEVGHALVSALQKQSQPVQKITIVPRTRGSLGYTMNMPEEERYLMTRSELLAEIASLLGGRAAESLVFGEVSTGAANDIERATAMARAMVTQYGMSENFGPIGLETPNNQYLNQQTQQSYSADTGGRIDTEVQSILTEAETTAHELLAQQRVSLDKITDYLLTQENISGEEFMQLLQEDVVLS